MIPRGIRRFWRQRAWLPVHRGEQQCTGQTGADGRLREGDVRCQQPTPRHGQHQPQDCGQRDDQRSVSPNSSQSFSSEYSRFNSWRRSIWRRDEPRGLLS